MRRNPLDTPYIEMCCKTLTDTFSPSHLLLERIVQMTQMSERLSRAFGESHERSNARPYAFLLEGSGRSFRSDINRIIEMAMHPDLQQHHSFFKLWQNYLFVRLYEPATRIKELEKEGIGPSMYRSLCLRNCLQAIKDYYEVFLSEPPTSSLYRTLLTFEQPAYVMLMTARLLLIDAPDFDVDQARRTLNFGHILDQIIQKLETADAVRKKAVADFAKESGLAVSDDELKVESRVADTLKKTRWFKEGFQAKVEGREHECGGMSEIPLTMGEYDRERNEPAIGWVNGMLADTAWSFEGFTTGYMLGQDAVTL